MSLRERLDAAIREWATREEHAGTVLGAGMDSDSCAAHREGLNCCLDVEHENYESMLDFLVQRLDKDGAIMDDKKIVEACARAAHEVNRAYCLAMGDESQPPWESAPEWQRASALKGVAGAIAGNTPERSHEGWLAEKAATGWKYGPVKDPEKKEHPCFVPYAELPPAQRHKDLLFVTVVKTMATALGHSIGSRHG